MALAHANYGGNEGSVEVEIKGGAGDVELPLAAEDVAQAYAVEDYAHLALSRDGNKVSFKDVENVPDGTHVVVYYRRLTEPEKELQREAEQAEAAARAERGE